MGVATAYRVEAKFGPAYRAQVLARDPVGYWRLDETTGACLDASGHGHHSVSEGADIVRGIPGAIVGDHDRGIMTPVDKQGTIHCGTSGPNLAHTLTAVWWLKGTTWTNGFRRCGPARRAGTTPNIRGWNIDTNGAGGASQGRVRFRVDTSGAESQSNTAAVPVETTWDGTWHQWALVLDEGDFTWYFDGQPIGAGTYTHGDGFGNADANFEIANLGLGYDLHLDEVSLYDRVLSAAEIAADYRAGWWTDITPDTIQRAGLSWTYGIQGSRPTDLVAGSGSCEVTLDNAPRPDGRLRGRYSPAHANCRPGWGLGVPIRIVQTYDGVARTRFRGVVDEIDPLPGTTDEQTVRVRAVDHMHLLMEADVRQIPVQVNQDAESLLHAVLDVLPPSVRPPARAIDTGLDVFPFTLWDLGDGKKAATICQQIAESDLTVMAVRGDGTFTSRNRHSRVTAPSMLVLDTLVGLRAPTSRAKQFNRVRARIHPVTLDETEVVLARLSGPVPPALQPGEIRHIWLDYQDPAQVRRVIGGRASDGAFDPAPGTDYAGHAAADGSGADLTADLSVTALRFSNSVRITIENTGASPVFLVDGTGAVLLQQRGLGVYDDGPQTFERQTPQTYGDRPLLLDMVYQDNPIVGDQAAEYIEQRWRDVARQVTEVSFLANRSHPLMVAARDCEPMDRITVTEQQTGLVFVDAFIQSVAVRVSRGPWVEVRWGLTPAGPYDAIAGETWQLGVEGHSELGVSTLFGLGAF